MFMGDMLKLRGISKALATKSSVQAVDGQVSSLGYGNNARRCDNGISAANPLSEREVQRLNGHGFGCVIS
jgi:hypothetical protein